MPQRSPPASADLRLDPVPPGMIDELWPWLAPLIERLCSRSRGELAPGHIRAQALSANLHVWVLTSPSDVRAPLAVVLLRFEDWSGETVCNIVGMTGNGLRRWGRFLVSEGQDRMRQLGVARIQFQARDGWLRYLPDFDKVRVVMEKRL